MSLDHRVTSHPSSGSRAPPLVSEYLSISINNNQLVVVISSIAPTYFFKFKQDINKRRCNAEWVFGGIPLGRNHFFRSEKNA
jgi:hypothetical protein